MAHFRPLLREHDITEQQWRVIRALYGSDGLEATVLADKTVLHMPSLTRILRTLEDKNWVKRFQVNGDNRRRLIRLASPGRKVYETIAPISEAKYEQIEKSLGADTLMQIHKLMDKISEEL